ncbi:hypothetical protein JX265_004366 [Neoarthrinium moseri]|uniref:Uncharacterized protein n=1 Tax=Neoarthrinium moseri TaxID=1658444 RepID=A0A9Q0ARK0_9PEZI|nr:hypothetical protein JX265_004366 [Neoarthrinium moseri]
MSWPSVRPTRPYGLIDLLREPIPNISAETKSDDARRTGLRDTAWLSLHPNHHDHVTRWRNFNYPVIRVALKELLDGVLDLSASFWHDYWPASLLEVGDGRSRNVRQPRRFEALGNQLNFALYHALMQRTHDPADPIWGALSYTPGHSEEAKNDDLSPICSLSYDWVLLDYEHSDEKHDGQCQPVVIGIDRSVDEFPLHLLGKFDEGGRLDERIEWTLRQVGTVCWYKKTPYAFVMTPAGATMLAFGVGAQLNSSPLLSVKYAVFPRDHNQQDVRKMPLLMALWSLCMIGWSDNARGSWNGSAGELNTWVQVTEGRGKLYEHSRLRQRNRGHPPGAVVIPMSARTPAPVLYPLGVAFKQWQPGDVENPFTSLPTSAGLSDSTVSPLSGVTVAASPASDAFPGLTRWRLREAEPVHLDLPCLQRHYISPYQPPVAPEVPVEEEDLRRHAPVPLSVAAITACVDTPEVPTRFHQETGDATRLAADTAHIATAVESNSDEQRNQASGDQVAGCAACHGPSASAVSALGHNYTTTSYALGRDGQIIAIEYSANAPGGWGMSLPVEYGPEIVQ